MDTKYYIFCYLCLVIKSCASFADAIKSVVDSAGGISMMPPGLFRESEKNTCLLHYKPK